MIIGITGGTGSGKTTLLSLLQEYGFTVLDCDEIYHRLLDTDKELLAAIEQRFPGTVENGVLRRKKLGALVFTDEAALADLNRITHARVKAEVMRLLDCANGNVAIDAIGLFESGLNKLCKLTIAVSAPEEIRIKRLMSRDNIKEEYARKRVLAQRSAEEFGRVCDYTLTNDSTPQVFREKCLAFLVQQGIINL